MRRFIAIALVALAAFSVFAGGNKESSSASDNTLSVAMECGYAPYNWTQPTDANGAVPIADSNDFANGYDVMMAKYIAEELGCSCCPVRNSRLRHRRTVNNISSSSDG